MGLISRIEVTNYLTEGINAHRRSVDWKPMLTGITLRMDEGKSALVNITNGGGKTSLVELLLFLLSRDARLLKKIREKVSPKNRGFTHARIEFRTMPEDNYSAPSLLEIDPQNLPGESHVVGVALNDDINDLPIFYSYSGTLEDSRCYIFDGKSIASVPDAGFIAKTKALRGCKWNKFTSRREWEDHIRLFLPIEVIRRNVAYQLKGSDDKNASFFDFKPKGGESYDSAFFRSVVAPDLLSNLLSTFSDEDEITVEDTLFKSLSRIVDADREITRKEHRLTVREIGIAKLTPILEIGKHAESLKEQRGTILRDLRKDVAYLRHFGLQGESTVMPGLPRKLPKMVESDPRILVALKGMVITRDDGILLLDKTLSELSGIDVGTLSKYAVRERLSSHAIKSQVIDFICLFVISGSGFQGGGHSKKGYSRESALAIPEIISAIRDAKTVGLKEVLEKAFEIAEVQIDTNPGSLAVRKFENQCKKLADDTKNTQEQIETLQTTIIGLETQIKDRQDNQGAWDDFVQIGNLLPDEIRAEPAKAKMWIDDESNALKSNLAERNERFGALREVWNNYNKVMDQNALNGIEGARDRHNILAAQRDKIKEDLSRIGRVLEAANTTLRSAQNAIGPLTTKVADTIKLLEKLEYLKLGYSQFRKFFGDIDPMAIDPLEDLKKINKKLTEARYAEKTNSDEADVLRSLQSQASAFTAIFGNDKDPLKCDPIKDQRLWTECESVARQSMAALNDKKEAIDEFEETHSDILPSDWIAATDQKREELLDAKEKQEACRRELNKEIKAIEEMRSVEDGAFEKAWILLDSKGLKAQRLHETILSADYSLDVRTDAMSALSGMLSAPVFNSSEEMSAAANTLQHTGISVPLLLKSTLLDAIHGGILTHGDVRIFGFIGGNFSRRVRILLDSEYAQTEFKRLTGDLSHCEEQLKNLAVQLPGLLTTSVNYQLACKARDALASKARENYLKYEKEAQVAGEELIKISPRVTLPALDVLRCAQSFSQKNGAERLIKLDEELQQLKSVVIEREAAEKIAKERASQEGLNARDSALEYMKMGGESAFHKAVDSVEQSRCELNVVKQVALEAGEQVDEASQEKTKIEVEAEEFEREKNSDEIARLRLVLEFSDNENNLKFMINFKMDQDTLSTRETSLINALSVNYVRAESFKLNQGKTELDLNREIAEKRQKYEELQGIIKEKTDKIRRLRGAEIPAWSSLAKAIHELAYELGHRVAQTTSVAEHVSEMEEGKAMPEVHPCYFPTETLLRALHNHKLEATGRLTEQIDEVTQLIQGIALNEGLNGYKRIESDYKAVFENYTNLNFTFCNEAEKSLGSADVAFNSLEIDEIRKATPSTMRTLAELFGRMQDSLNKDRDDAQRAKLVAEETNEDTIHQLSRLILSAEDNLTILNKVMQRYSGGRFFIETQINKDEKIKGIIDELKIEVERTNREMDNRSMSHRRSNETQLKEVLRDKLIECVFTNTKVEFVNAGIWSGKQNPVSERLSTGQKIALEFMWIVRQAEYEIERSLTELSSKQAAKSRAKANRVILIDGIFSTLSDRKIIKEALNGLRGLGGNFQIIGFLHSPSWVNDSTVFPIYHVGKKLSNSAGDGLVSFREIGRESGSVGFFSLITQPSAQISPA